MFFVDTGDSRIVTNSKRESNCYPYFGLVIFKHRTQMMPEYIIEERQVIFAVVLETDRP